MCCSAATTHPAECHQIRKWIWQLTWYRVGVFQRFGVQSDHRRGCCTCSNTTDIKQVSEANNCSAKYYEHYSNTCLCDAHHALLTNGEGSSHNIGLRLLSCEATFGSEGMLLIGGWAIGLLIVGCDSETSVWILSSRCLPLQYISLVYIYIYGFHHLHRTF